MVKLLIGKKGTGKTKKLIALANEAEAVVVHSVVDADAILLNVATLNREAHEAEAWVEEGEEQDSN